MKYFTLSLLLINTLQAHIFYYKAEIYDTYIRKYDGTKTIRIKIPDLRSGITLQYNKDKKPLVYWSELHRRTPLKIKENSKESMVFPMSIPKNSMVMLGLDRPKEYINKGK